MVGGEERLKGRFSRRGRSCVSLVFASGFVARVYRARFSDFRVRRFCLSRSTRSTPLDPLDPRSVPLSILPFGSFSGCLPGLRSSDDFAGPVRDSLVRILRQFLH
jgi:hypothetical protein